MGEEGWGGAASGPEGDLGATDILWVKTQSEFQKKKRGRKREIVLPFFWFGRKISRVVKIGVKLGGGRKRKGQETGKQMSNSTGRDNFPAMVTQRGISLPRTASHDRGTRKKEGKEKPNSQVKFDGKVAPENSHLDIGTGSQQKGKTRRHPRQKDKDS